MPPWQPQPRLKIAIAYNNFGPYHLARLATAAKLGKGRGIQVVGLELASQEKLHPWTVDEVSIQGLKYTLFPGKAIEEVQPLALACGMWSALAAIDPQAVALGLSRETHPAMLAALVWTRRRKRVAISLTDSKFDDSPRPPWKEWTKKLLYHWFDAALVGGSLSHQYAQNLGIAKENIFIGCDVVDNNFFAQEARQARENPKALRAKYSLPANYFLFVGRLDENKNLFRLLIAYEHYLRLAEEQSWGLVICGSGPVEAQARALARQLNLPVLFAGFKQLEELPIYYGLSRCLIFSSLGDTWGLVVNEAMASGLPVLVSKACGCAPDLVQEGVNGYTFDPYDVEGLARLLLKVTSQETDCDAMGRASQQIIAEWGLERFAEQLFQTVAAGQASRNGNSFL
jgi:1,2-diacylglycerol 3-alpha-glucosyltransferase